MVENEIQLNLVFDSVTDVSQLNGHISVLNIKVLIKVRIDRFYNNYVIRFQ